MKTQFKPGDRVAVYGVGGRVVGRIAEVISDNAVKVMYRYGSTEHAHPKQCRRLKPKRNPEVIEFECEWQRDITQQTNGEPMIFPIGLIPKNLVGKRTKVRVEILK